MYSLQVTPTANRNSYRVARVVVQLPRVACFARNPGLGKRNSYRVAAAYGGCTRSPSLALPKGRELSPLPYPNHGAVVHCKPLPNPPQGAGIHSRCV